MKNRIGIENSKDNSGPHPISKMDDPGNRFIKRVMDIIESFVVILFCLPLIILISIAIKLESKGPVLYRQERVGRDGHLFKLLKFRTMYIDDREQKNYIKMIFSKKSEIDHESIRYKLHNDPRITKVGKFLRKTSLDEFPQLINVLKGEMSLIGPRPPLPFELETYKEWHKNRLRCKPGLSGLWQISGRSATTFDEMVKLDIKYIEHWSLWLDIKICFSTISLSLKKDNF